MKLSSFHIKKCALRLAIPVTALALFSSPSFGAQEEKEFSETPAQPLWDGPAEVGQLPAASNQARMVQAFEGATTAAASSAPLSGPANPAW